jgi:hypothetical protein
MRLDKASKAQLMKAYSFAQWNKPVSSSVLPAAAALAAQIQGYEVLVTRKLDTGESIPAYHLFWTRSGESVATVATQVFEAGSLAKAGDLMLYLLGQFEGPPLEPMPAISEVSFSTKGHRLVIFKKQNLVVVVTNTGNKPSDLSAFAASLSRALEAQANQSPGKRARRAVKPESKLR